MEGSSGLSTILSYLVVTQPWPFVPGLSQLSSKIKAMLLLLQERSYVEFKGMSLELRLWINYWLVILHGLDK